MKGNNNETDSNSFGFYYKKMEWSDTKQQQTTARKGN
jgi:hypothetical protein